MKIKCNDFAIIDEMNRIESESVLGSQEAMMEQDMFNWWYTDGKEVTTNTSIGNYITHTVINKYAEYQGWTKEIGNNFQIATGEETLIHTKEGI